MNAIKNFFATFNISTHTIAAAILSGVGLYTTVPAVQAFVDSIVKPYPKISGLVTALVAVALAYKGSHSTQGQVALIAATPPQKVADAITAIKVAAAPPVVVPPPAVNMQNVVAAAAAAPVVPPAAPKV